MKPRVLFLALALTACSAEAPPIVRTKQTPSPSGATMLTEHIVVQGGAKGYIEVTLTLEHAGEKAVIAEYPHFSGAFPHWEGEHKLFLCADGVPTRFVKKLQIKGEAFEITDRCEEYGQ